MTDAVRYGRMTFESDFRFGTDEQGATIRFSRAERALLSKLTQNARAVLRRDDLLDAISGPGSDGTDRNIDFLINRLRRKLGDSARSPTYIATQYGEGYVWVADRVTQSANTCGAFLVVGPIRGLRHLGSWAVQAKAYAAELRLSLDRQTAKERRVVIDEDCPSADAFTGEKPRFAAELSFLATGDRLDCAVTLKDFPSGHIVRVSRHTVASGDPGSALDRAVIEPTAGELLTAIWDVLAYRASRPATPSDEPLAVRMHNAVLLLKGERESWMETNRRLVAALQNEPDNPELQLMLAINIHSKYLTSGPMVFLQPDRRREDEDEIERLVLASLPKLQDNPVFAMAAGKLLYFIDRGHRTLGLGLAEQAFDATTAFAASFATLGQMRMQEGDIEAALALFEQGLELSEPGTEFHVYLLVVKCEALLAADQRDALRRALDVLYAAKAGTREALALYFASPDPKENPPEVSQLLQRVEPALARAMLAFCNYVFARLFRFAEHRENILRGPLTLFVERFGRDVIPDDVRASVPALAAQVGAHLRDGKAARR